MKSVFFAGHRFQWHNVGVAEKLLQTVESLINKGFYVFYIGGNGYFDELAEQTVRTMKRAYPHIKNG